MGDLHERLLAGILRLGERLGPLGDPAGVLRAFADGVVEDVGVKGAAIHELREGSLALVCAAGDAPDAAFAARVAASSGPVSEGELLGFPLARAGRTLGAFVVRGADEARAPIVSMVAGRCADVLAEARRVGALVALVRGLSHEVRAPLQALLGHLDLLEQGAFGALNERQAEAVGRSVRSAERILAVIRDVLQVARIDAGYEEARLEPVRLDGLLAAEAETVSALARAAGLALSVECPSGFVVRTDPAKVARIVGNLLSNAIKYTPSGGVVLRAGAAEGGAFVEVEDTGPGIPREKQEAVFQPFVRLDRTRDGTGLGLSLSRRLAELLGARLSLRSRPGSGSVFRLDLPA